jgi:hypothetical protein
VDERLCNALYIHEKKDQPDNWNAQAIGLAMLRSCVLSVGRDAPAPRQVRTPATAACTADCQGFQTSSQRNLQSSEPREVFSEIKMYAITAIITMTHKIAILRNFKRRFRFAPAIFITAGSERRHVAGFWRSECRKPATCRRSALSAFIAGCEIFGLECAAQLDLPAG